jgi:hypothetical protein
MPGASTTELGGHVPQRHTGHFPNLAEHALGRFD